MCINYANEVLQKFFSDFVFTLERSEYEKENLKLADDFNFPYNESCVKLLGDVRTNKHE